MTGVLCLFAACGHRNLPVAQSTELLMKVLYAGQTCPCKTSQPELIWLDDRQKLAQFMEQARQSMLGSTGDLAGPVDFSSHRVLAIAMGRQSTAGFGLSLDGEQARLKGDSVVIPVVWSEPQEGAKVAQMLTSPCLLIQLPVGDYTQVWVQDQNDRTRARLSLLE